jgi:energy-coupling factor transport system substrate-specific component
MTAGVGPWLPFQMLCSAWVATGAGLLPRRPRGRAEIAMLAAYGVVAAYSYGLLMNLQGWPFNLGTVEVPDHQGSLAFDPSASLGENLHTFAAYTLLTSTGSFDTGRAITTALCVVLLGPAILTTLRRASRRAVVLGRSAPDRDPEDAVVAGGGLAAAVPVAGGDPERAVRGERDRAHPAVLADEEGTRPDGAAAGDGDPPQPLAP